jgi:hypothetical protein
MSISLEAALLVRSILDFFINQVKVIKAEKEAEGIQKHCIGLLNLTLTGNLTNIFINSVFNWKRTDQPL